MHPENPLTPEELSASPPFWREDRCRWSTWSRAKRRTCALHREKSSSGSVEKSSWNYKKKTESNEDVSPQMWWSHYRPRPGCSSPERTQRSVKTGRHRTLLQRWSSSWRRCTHDVIGLSLLPPFVIFHFFLATAGAAHPGTWRSLSDEQSPRCFITTQTVLDLPDEAEEAQWSGVSPPLLLEAASVWEFMLKDERRSWDAPAALTLFIRGSGNYLLTRTLNKRGAINNHKQR